VTTTHYPAGPRPSRAAGTSAGNFPASGNSRAFTITLARVQMRGNVRHWGYRVLALDKDLHVLHSMEKKYH
jgi:hypothetical protein